jgi:hypothetical protein
MSLDIFRKTTEQKGWKLRTQLLLEVSNISVEMKEEFGTYWIEAGHHIREQISDDRQLVRFLRHLLPPYDGDALTLFRGESLERWINGTVGLAWTPKIEVARMFASGLNSVGSGGVLLAGRFEAKAIISGSNPHSCYLGEEQLTVDPFYGTNLMAIEQFAPER